MGTVQVRSLDQPDGTRSLPNGAVETVTIADTMIGWARFEPWVTADFSQAMTDHANPGEAA